jgi:agmatine deiminase
MKNITLLVICLLAIACTQKDKTKLYMPAEWEKQDAVWLGWESEFISYHPVVYEMVRALSPHVQVKLAADSDSLLRVAKKLLSENKIDTSSIQFYTMPGERYWIRDHGAAFLTNENGELGVANFSWNGYGRPAWLKEKYDNNTDSITKYLYAASARKTGMVDSLMAVATDAKQLTTWVNHEGGAIEVNGKGTLILCEATVLQRNPGKTKEQLEPEFKRVLGVTKIIWMKKGLADDPMHFFRRIAGNYVGGGTGGHTDEFVRFSNPNTVMLAWVDEAEKDLNPINQINFERMSENLSILQQSSDQDGKPFNIVKVPLPDLAPKTIVARARIADRTITLDVRPALFKKLEAPAVGDTLLRVPASSYMNFLITNGAVLIASYTAAGTSKEKEERVRQIFKEQFPGRELYFIDAMPLNWSGGGIHCSTQQQPAIKK